MPKGVIRIRISKKNRQQNGQKKNGQKKNGQKKNGQKKKQLSTKHTHKTEDTITIQKIIRY